MFTCSRLFRVGFSIDSGICELAQVFFCLFDVGQLEIYDMIGQAISSSRRAGGEVRSSLCCVSVLSYHFQCVNTSAHAAFCALPTALSELPAAGCLVLVKQPFPHSEPESHCLG